MNINAATLYYNNQNTRQLTSNNNHSNSLIKQKMEFSTTLRNKLTGEFEPEIDSREILQDKIKEMQSNIEAGNVDFEPVFQIGGKAYTQEEWDKLLEYVDEVEEETQEMLEVEKAMKEAEEVFGD